MQETPHTPQHSEEDGDDIPKTIEFIDSRHQRQFNRDLEKVETKPNNNLFTEDILSLYQNQADPQPDEYVRRERRAPIKPKKKEPKSSPKLTIYQSLTQQNQKLLEGYVIQYKEYLRQSTTTNSKFLNLKLQLFKLLMIGMFELRILYNGASTQKALTSKEKNIAEPKTIAYDWIKKICDIYQEEFKKAESTIKYFNPINKWDTLVKGCRDQSNHDLRKRIVTRAIKPKNVIQNPDIFLLSPEARAQFERRERLILAQAGKDFEKVDEQIVIQSDHSPGIEEGEMIIPSLNSMPSIDAQASSPLLKRRQTQQNRQIRQKINEYRQFLDKEMLERMRNRIEEDLKGNQSYEKIMGDFKTKFETKLLAANSNSPNGN